MLFLALGHRGLLPGPEGQSLGGVERGLDIKEKTAFERKQMSGALLGWVGGGGLGSDEEDSRRNIQG